MFAEFLLTLRSSATKRAYREDLGYFARWFKASRAEELSSDKVTAVDLQDYQSHLAITWRLAPTTVNRRLAAVKAWLAWCAETGAVKALPRFPKRLAEPQRPPRSLERVDENRLLRAIERQGNDRDRALVGLMLFAGLRVGETVKLKVGDVEIKERRGKVVVAYGKGMKWREVPLSAKARALVGPWLEKQETLGAHAWLFPGRTNGGHLTVRAAQDVVKKYVHLGRLCEQAAAHALRHTFATRLVRAGVGLDVVAQILGHARVETTAKYTRARWVELEEAVERR